MCIFCGGQCGGIGEFLISLGLPFLALYFSRIKNALLRIKHKFFHAKVNPEHALHKAGKYRFCGEWPIGKTPKSGLMGQESPSIQPLPIPIDLTKFNNRHKLEIKSRPKGIKGWLLLLCLNLTIFTPAACLYEANCSLDLLHSFRNNIYLSIFKSLLFYNVIVIIFTIFLTIFSFVAGLKLWEKKPGAVKTTKIFLVTQLFLTFILASIRPFMAFPLGSNEWIFVDVLKHLILALCNFSFWYLYLIHSQRVHNTYSNTERKPESIGHLPIKLTSYTAATR